MIDWPDVDSITGISDHQREQISFAMRGNIGLFSGGPGTGKTHTIGRLLKAIQQTSKHLYSVRVLAPTGKAAQRMTESLNDAELSIHATTIHVGLVPSRGGHDGKGWGFFHCESNPIEADLIIIDESSMIDISLMSSLLSAIKPGCKLLLVGDPFQLAPVGRGCPFSDMIKAGMPHGHLTETHRFAGRIATVCEQINAGERWSPSKTIDLDSDYPENMRHVESTDVMKSIEDLLVRLKSRGFDPMRDVQVICATNDTRERFNERLQLLLNPTGEIVEGCKFRTGDKVICLRNQFATNYQDPDDDDDDYTEGQSYVANGEIGTVRKTSKSFIVVEFTSSVVRFSKAAWNDISLAYCITGWKAQGSQWPVVITCTEDNRGSDLICDRSFWYTSISRAKTLSITVGKRCVIDRQCSRVSVQNRKTFLREKIISLLNMPEIDSALIAEREQEPWLEFADV